MRASGANGLTSVGSSMVARVFLSSWRVSYSSMLSLAGAHSSVYRKCNPLFSPCADYTARPRSDQRSICAMFCENFPLDRVYWSLRRPGYADLDAR